jgi:hypothetical protein
MPLSFLRSKKQREKQLRWYRIGRDEINISSNSSLVLAMPNISFVSSFERIVSSSKFKCRSKKLSDIVLKYCQCQAEDNMIIYQAINGLSSARACTRHHSRLPEHKTNFCSDTKLSTRHLSRQPEHKTNFCVVTQNYRLDISHVCQNTKLIFAW